MTLYAITIGALTFVLGVSIGSFLNVVIYRMGSGTRLTGRSKCLSCGKTLRAWMLVPLASFLIQRGRCAHCGARLSQQYPLVEFSTGLLFLLAAVRSDLLLPLLSSSSIVIAALTALIWSLFVVIFVYDVKHKIIPDTLSLLLALFSGVLLFVRYRFGLVPVPYLPFFDATPGWIDWLAAPIVALPLALVWLLTLGRGMGLGDAKLAWGIGWFLGLGGAVTAVVFAFWIAFVPAVSLLFLRGKRFTMKSEIPFAPFLVLGTLVAYLFGVDLLRWTF